MFSAILKSISNSIALIYQDHIDTNNYIQGQIVTHSDSLIAIVKYDNLGIYDGIEIIRIENITKIRTRCNETFLLEKLVKENLSELLGDISISSIAKCSKTLCAKYEYISLHTKFDQTISGIIIKTDSQSLLIEEFKTNQFNLLYTSDIIAISADSKYQRKLFQKKVKD